MTTLNRPVAEALKRLCEEAGINPVEGSATYTAYTTILRGIRDDQPDLVIVTAAASLLRHETDVPRAEIGARIDRLLLEERRDLRADVAAFD